MSEFENFVIVVEDGKHFTIAKWPVISASIARARCPNDRSPRYGGQRVHQKDDVESAESGRVTSNRGSWVSGIFRLGYDSFIRKSALTLDHLGTRLERLFFARQDESSLLT